MIKLILFLLLFNSCSLVERRRDYFKGLRHGMTEKELIGAYGEPDMTNSISRNENVLMYEYCGKSRSFDGLIALLTVGLGSVTCAGFRGQVGVYVRDNEVEKIDYDYAGWGAFRAKIAEKEAGATRVNINNNVETRD